MARGRILVADDNPDILRLVEVNLNFEDYETIGARNGEEAVEMARRELPDLIILDVMLPKMDGWQVLSQLKAEPRTAIIPVIIMTGSSLRDRRERELVQGVADYLSKPFNPLRLLEIVNEQIEGRRRHPSQAEPSTAKRTRVVVLHGQSGGTTLLQNLLGNPTVEIIAVVGSAEAEGLALARDLQLPTVSTVEALGEGIHVDVYIDAREGTDAKLQARAARQGAEVLSGRTLLFLRQLLAERDASHLKERDLVRELKERVEELSILNEMARLVASPFDMPELYKRALNLTLRIAGLSAQSQEEVAAGCVLVYDEQLERFVAVARVGLSERFQEKARLPLSDPMVDELLTLRRPLTITEVDEQYPSALMASAARENLASMACLPLMVKDKVIGMLLVGTRQRHVYKREEMNLLSGLAAQMGMVIENAYLHQASRQKQVLIEQLLGKVILAQEDERKRLAAEIHDSIAQSLAGMLTQIQISQSLLASGATDKVVEQLASIRAIIADSVREVRNIIFNLRPSSLDDLGLIPSIEHYVRRFERDSHVSITLTHEDMPSQRLPSTLETTIFRIVQESLTNIKKHANARSVRIRLSADGYQVSLKIIDDGQGFKWPEVTDKFFRGESHGVEGMKERTALLGGTFHIQSQEGAGTVVRVDIPVPRSEGKADSGGIVVESSALAAVSQSLARLGEQALDSEEEQERVRREAQASRKVRVGDKPESADTTT